MAKTAHGKDPVSKFDTFFDSDAFVGLYLPEDAHFVTASSLYQRMKAEDQSVVTSSWVVAETATVLSHRAGQAQAIAFLSMIEQSQFPVIHINEELQQEATHLFKAQTQKGTSMTDCSNVVLVRRFAIPAIFSFDKVYRKHFGLPMVAATESI